MIVISALTSSLLTRKQGVGIQTFPTRVRWTQEGFASWMTWCHFTAFLSELPVSSARWTSARSLCPWSAPLLFSAADRIASGEVDVSPAGPTHTKTGQFTYQADQKMQCLSVTLFLSLLNENESHAMCEIGSVRGSDRFVTLNAQGGAEIWSLQMRVKGSVGFF